MQRLNRYWAGRDVGISALLEGKVGLLKVERAEKPPGDPVNV